MPSTNEMINQRLGGTLGSQPGQGGQAKDLKQEKLVRSWANFFAKLSKDPGASSLLRQEALAQVKAIGEYGPGPTNELFFLDDVDQSIQNFVDKR